MQENVRKLFSGSMRIFFDLRAIFKRARGIPGGTLRRITPISCNFGVDRGQPVDRYYIEAFMDRHNLEIRGCVLEIGEPVYTRRYGGEKVIRSEVLHVVEGNPDATMVGDLATGKGIPNNLFDCMILTQVFHCIYDVHTAAANAYGALKPGGILLATLPGISQISRYDNDRWGDYWRFTEASAKKIFGDVFGSENVSVETHGNVFAACAFLHGLAAEELTKEELDYKDLDYQITISVRAEKR